MYPWHVLFWSILHPAYCIQGSIKISPQYIHLCPGEKQVNIACESRSTQSYHYWTINVSLGTVMIIFNINERHPGKAFLLSSNIYAILTSVMTESNEDGELVINLESQLHIIVPTGFQTVVFCSNDIMNDTIIIQSIGKYYIIQVQYNGCMWLHVHVYLVAIA